MDVLVESPEAGLRHNAIWWKSELLSSKYGVLVKSGFCVDHYRSASFLSRLLPRLRCPNRVKAVFVLYLHFRRDILNKSLNEAQLWTFDTSAVSAWKRIQSVCSKTHKKITENLTFKPCISPTKNVRDAKISDRVRLHTFWPSPKFRWFWSNFIFLEILDRVRKHVLFMHSRVRKHFLKWMARYRAIQSKLGKHLKKAGARKG